MTIRKMIMCGSVLLIGIFCAAGCGRVQTPAGGGSPAQDSVTEEQEASGAEIGDAGMEAGEAEREEAGIGADGAEDGESGAGIGADGAENGESGAGTRTAGTPCPLSVSGARLTDQDGNPVQLRGISTHGLAWYPEYVNAECFRQLKEEWAANVVRLAMYTAESGGYCTGGNQEDLKALVKEGVEYATDCGLYVIIDWHILSDGNPNTYLDQAKEFFREMSGEYAEYENVLYEICNEPNGGVSWNDIKAYAEQVIPVIREQDADGVILVGTPNWSQYVDQAAADPITGYDNIMYTLHFYAATHTDSLRDTMVKAVEAGLPVFVSEYGICDASGNGAIDRTQADKWMEVMDEYGISYVAWNLSNKSETSAILKNSCGKTSGFNREDLSDSGAWLVETLGGSGNAGGASADGPAGDTHLPGTGNGADTKAPGGDSADKPASPAPGTESVQNPPKKPAGTEPGGESPESDQLSVQTKLINSWEQNQESYYQYEATVTNSGDRALDSWKIILTFEGDITLENGWNGNYQTEGNTLTITNMDYNGYLDTGGSAENIGFILKIAP